MKKIIFLAICLFTAGAASAQRYYDGPRHRPPRRVVRREPRGYDDFNRIKVGLAAGLNVSNTIDAYDPNFSTNSIAGWHVGLTMDVPIAYPISFAPELMFSQKGFSGDDSGVKFTQRTNYIDVPLLLKLKLVPNFNVLVGPQLSFLTSTKNTYQTDYNTVYEERYNNRGDQSVVSGVIGFSVDLNPNVELRARYNIDLSVNHPNDNSNLPDYRNQVWQLGLGFKFQ